MFTRLFLMLLVLASWFYQEINQQEDADLEPLDSLDDNVHNVAVDGSFDDCQDFVKELFGDADIKRTHQLAAVNSINWARILAQMYVRSISSTSMRLTVRIRLRSMNCYHRTIKASSASDAGY